MMGEIHPVGSQPTASEWHVAFVDDGSPLRWWDFFTRPGFRHCFAFRYDLGADRWLVVDPAWGVMHVLVMCRHSFARFISSRSPTISACLRMGARYEHKPHLKIFAWCSWQCAYILGLDRIVFTPHKLYRVMREAGAVEAWGEVCRYGRDFQRAEDSEI